MESDELIGWYSTEGTEENHVTRRSAIRSRPSGLSPLVNHRLMFETALYEQRPVDYAVDRPQPGRFRQWMFARQQMTSVGVKPETRRAPNFTSRCVSRSCLILCERVRSNADHTELLLTSDIEFSCFRV